MSWRYHVKSSSNRAVYENAAENLAITKRNITKRTNNNPYRSLRYYLRYFLFPSLCLIIVDRVYEIFQSCRGPSSFSSRLCKLKGISYLSNKGNQRPRSFFVDSASEFVLSIRLIDSQLRFYVHRALRLDDRWSHLLWPFDSTHARTTQSLPVNTRYDKVNFNGSCETGRGMTERKWNARVPRYIPFVYGICEQKQARERERERDA